ncbi:histidine kinase [Streptomyces sp. NPDC093252]|uniref:sensor histidine kinase n=1 Tax=Streptomyces sp. NPDC093252 TaxID=3154980 RepID=UPI003442DD76
MDGTNGDETSTSTGTSTAMPTPTPMPTSTRTRTRPRTCLHDAALWTALTTPTLLTELLGLNEPRPLWQRLAGAAVLGVAVAVSRRSPLTAFALTAALSLATAPALFTLAYAPALATLALLLGLRERPMRPAALCFTAVGCAGTARIALLGVDPAPEWLVLMCTLLFCCVFPWLAGRHRRQGRELAEAGWLRAARLEDEQRHAEERARLRERARIAQDMHDSLGHDLSLIALRAGALQVATDLPTHHRAAVADLRAAAADATDRLHGVIGVLREDDDEPAPLAPAGETLEQLVARTAESGLPVRLERAGTEPAPTPEPGGVTGRLLHRVVREALTNAARHAPGATVVVTVTGEDRGIAVTVSNGPATQSSSRPARGGSGLLGLRAAVTAIGGTFEAGPCGEGPGPYGGDGFRVRAWAPERAAERAGGPTAGPTAGQTAGPTAGATAERPPERTHRRPAQAGPQSRPLPWAQSRPHPRPHPRSQFRPLSRSQRRSQPRPPSPSTSGTGAGRTTRSTRSPSSTAPTPTRSTPTPHARKRTALPLWAAGGTGLLLLGVAFAWYAYTETHSVLHPDTYARLHLGMTAAEIEPLLPDRAVTDPPADRAPVPPPGANCAYYRSSGELLVSVDHFRLCYDDGERLIVKDVVPGVGRPGDAYEEGTAR